MNRALLLSAVFALLATGLSAGPVEDSIARQLIDQGYNEIRIGRTLLGRSRIVATSDSIRREIVVNPRTGEILRDYIQRMGSDRGSDGTLAPDIGGGSIGATPGTGGSGAGASDEDDDSGQGRGRGRGRGGDDDDVDDDDARDNRDDHDDDRESNSGSSGSSGSGSSGSSGSGSSGSGGDDDGDDGDDDD